VSEDNSARDKQEESLQQGDGAGDNSQADRLDLLIAQFEDDFDWDMTDDADQANQSDRSEPSVDDEAELLELDESALDESDLDESDLDETDLDDLASLPMQTAAAAEEPNNRFGMLVGGLIALAVIGIALWPSSGDDEKHTLIKQPVTNTSPVQAVKQPGTVLSSDESLPAASEESQVEDAAPEQVEAPVEQPPVVKLQDVQTKSEEAQAQVEQPVVSKQEKMVAAVSPRSAAPKISKRVIRWGVNLTSVSTLASAEKIQKGLEGRGITSELNRVTIGGKIYYRIRIPGFASKQEAEQARLPYLKEREFSSAWLERYRAVVPSPE